MPGKEICIYDKHMLIGLSFSEHHFLEVMLSHVISYCNINIKIIGIKCDVQYSHMISGYGIV